MIYYVTNQPSLISSPYYTVITSEESLNIIKDWKCAQADSETTGLDPHIDTLLLFQLGSIDGETQIVIDCTTVDIKIYKEFLESVYLEFHNGKFDLQFLYSAGIVPRKVYDTMIVEQLLYLGYPSGAISYSLKAVAERRLGVSLDKTVRGKIIWKGVDDEVILYAANDVKYLHQIMRSQSRDFSFQRCRIGAKLECDCVPAMAYLEWCGIKLDEAKWKAKMDKDKANLCSAKDKLNKFVVSNNYKQFFHIDTQGDLWEGFNDNPIVDINWDSPAQVIKFAKFLGFDTTVQDKKTGEDKDSVLEKHLKMQDGVNDEFLKLYFDYKEYSKVCSSFGQGHLNAINPITRRIHTDYHQLGAASGRMSCGNIQGNPSIARMKKLPQSECIYPNIQQLPNDPITRGCFVAEKGNLFCSCDYSAQEARVAADVYNDQALKDIFLKGIDSHSMYAKVFFKKELEGIDVKDVKKLRPDLRQKAKSPEFALNYGGGYPAIMAALKCSKEEAELIIKNYEEGFKGTAEFARKASKFVREHGYVLINPITGHKMYWWDWKQWKERSKKFTQEFWEDYKKNHKGTGDEVAKEVSVHFKAASKWDRMGRNAPCQGTSAIMTKTALINLFKYILENNLFGVVKIVAVVHDEISIEYPETMPEMAKKLEEFMEESAKIYCTSVPIPAVAEVDTCWKH